MIIVHVELEVLAEHLPSFIQTTQELILQSKRETGLLRYEVVQSIENPTHFFFNEIYRNKKGLMEHQQSGHFQDWVNQTALWYASTPSVVRCEGLVPIIP